MAAPTLAQIREGLKTRFATIDDVQPLAYRISSPTYPCVFVLGPDEVDYHQAMGNGMDSWTLTVMALVGNVSDIGAQVQLDELVSATGAKSVKAAIEAEPTLGGVVDDLIVHKCTGYRVYGHDAQMLGAEWTVQIIADGA